MCSLFCSLFQVHIAFCYVVMGANARRRSWTQNKIIASKTELAVKKLNSVFLRYSVILITLLRYVTLRKGILRLRDRKRFLLFLRYVIL